MIILLFLTVVVCSVCQSYIAKETNGGGLNHENSKLVILGTTISVSMGLLLYYFASFGIEMYEENSLDFYDYGKITTQGIMYFAAKLVGAITVAESAINALVCMTLGLKKTNQ